MVFDDTHNAFFALVRAGLWEKDIRLSSFGEVSYKDIYRLAEEQSVTGLVAAGIEHVQDVKISKDIALTFVGHALQLEQRNIAINRFIARQIEELRKHGIYSILVKGQGIALCYERPLWRASGDVDLLLDKDDYQKAKIYLSATASTMEEEDSKRLHLGLIIGSFEVELHGTLHSRQLPELNKVVDDAQYDVFRRGMVRVWRNEETDIFLPGENQDVVFVFSHILQHYFGGGIGLRQICDWCRLLWTNKDRIDVALLESRLRKGRIMTEWKTFAAFAVEWLGMPIEAMPLYSDSHRWSRKTKKIADFIIINGNFGCNRNNSFRKQYPTYVRKMISLWRYICDTARHIMVFPLDSISVFGRMVWDGIHLKGLR